MSARATHRSEPQDETHYTSLRQALMQDAATRERLPQAVRVCRSLEHFWDFIKSMYGGYAERRDYLRREFEPLLSYLESHSDSPVDNLLGDALEEFSAEEVKRVWDKAIERRKSDPEAAITMARSLIESVCKHILDESGEDYSNSDQLYKQTETSMNLAQTSKLSSRSNNSWDPAKASLEVFTRSGTDLETLMVEASPMQPHYHGTRS